MTNKTTAVGDNTRIDTEIFQNFAIFHNFPKIAKNAKMFQKSVSNGFPTVRAPPKRKFAVW
jgi:hypothetical protein